MYFRLKKIEQTIDIYNKETCERADERNQLPYIKAVESRNFLTNKVSTEEKQTCLCGKKINRNNIPIETF